MGLKRVWEFVPGSGKKRGMKDLFGLWGPRGPWGLLGLGKTPTSGCSHAAV